MDQLVLREKVGANYMLMEIEGVVNAYTDAELQEKLYRYITDINVVLDMNLVTQLDSSGVGTVLAAFNDGEKYGTKLFIMNPSESVRRALERTGFYDMFYVIHSVTEVSNE